MNYEFMSCGVFNIMFCVHFRRFREPCDRSKRNANEKKRLNFFRCNDTYSHSACQQFPGPSEAWNAEPVLSRQRPNQIFRIRPVYMGSKANAVLIVSSHYSVVSKICRRKYFSFCFVSGHFQADFNTVSL